MQKISATLIAATILSLTGCQSVGLQYQFPSVLEKTARLQGTSGVFINNLNDKGCYYGRTSIDHMVRVRADEPLALGFEARFTEHEWDFFRESERYSCRVIFRFTPQEDAVYRITKRFDELTGKKTWGSTEVDVCRIGVQQQMDDGSFKAVPIESLSLRRVKWNCMKLKSAAEDKADEEAEAREEAEEDARDAAKAQAKANAVAKAAASADTKAK